jgi:hypothetical protein
VAASNPPLIASSSSESRLAIRGNPHREFARKSMGKLQFPANPVAGISPFPVPDQALQDISRSTTPTRGNPTARHFAITETEAIEQPRHSRQLQFCQRNGDIAVAN